MRNLKLIFLMMLATALTFTSCNGDEEDTNPPTIKFSGEQSKEITPAQLLEGERVVFNVDINAEEKIKSFEIKEVKIGLNVENSESYDAEKTKESKGKTKDTYNFDRTFSASDFVNGVTKIEYDFIVTDKEDKTTKKTFTVSIKYAAAITPLATEITNGVIYNLMGTEKGAWDLVSNVAKASTDATADKDMINTTGSDAVFVPGFEAGNNTMFVKSNMPYDSFPSEETAKAYYMQGTAVSTVSEIATGDVYVAKLRGEDNYAVIKITNVVSTDNDNNDKIEFTYKKQ